MRTRLGRDKDAKVIRRANRAGAVGRLLLGEYRNWHDFLEADTIDLESLPRRQLRSGRIDVRGRLRPEIQSFCDRNFLGMDEATLSALYEDIKSFRGLEIPLSEFEDRFARVQPHVLRGAPRHTTISISLWGLQFKFPEDELSKDVGKALRLGTEAKHELKQFEALPHANALKSRNKIGSLWGQKSFAARSAILLAFNLMEAYLNGLAWDFVASGKSSNLSNTKKKLLEETTSVTMRDKLIKYPEILAQQSLWTETDPEVKTFLDIVKPFRDSLVHPSPFTTPAKFGGHDKLRLLYRIDYDTAQMTVTLIISLIRRIHAHVQPPNTPIPPWVESLASVAASPAEDK